MMTFAVQRLDEGARPALLAHFLALSVMDRCMRFGTPLPTVAIADYIDRIDFDRDSVFGVEDDRFDLVGVAHLAIRDDLAEIGLSVHPAHRCRGLGAALFKRALAHARNRRIAGFFMQFLSGNAPIVHLARTFGMDIVARAGEGHAHLKLLPASLSSIAMEWAMDTFAFYARAAKALVTAWRRQRRAGAPTT